MMLKAVMMVDCRASEAGHAYAGSRLTALEEVANRPIVHHVLDALREISPNQIIVAGEADALIDIRACLRDYQPGLGHVEYVVCQAEADIPGTFRALAPLVGEAPCLVQPADGLLEEPLSAALAEVFERGSLDLLLFPRRQGDGVASGDGVVGRERVPGRERVAGRAECTSAAENGAGLGPAMGDVGVFGARAFGRVTEQLRRCGGTDLAAAGKLLVASGGRVGLCPGDGWHRYRGHGADLLTLNRMVLDRLGGSIPPSARAGNRFEGRVLVDPTATLRSSVITGPAVIGPGATVIDAYIGPYTSIGAGARIEGVEIERSIVAAGASVVHVGGRLVSSLVGRDARVYRDFSLPRALRLWVGSGDEVALC
jgi:glucose-1-phosphate thymidylyltransferase